MLAISIAKLAATGAPVVPPPPPPPPARLPLVRRISSFWATALKEGGETEGEREKGERGREGERERERKTE